MQRPQQLQQQVDDGQVVVLHHGHPLHLEPPHVGRVQNAEDSKQRFILLSMCQE